MYLQGNFENNLAEAFNLMNTGKIDKAINLFENLTEQYPKTARGFHLKAFAYTQDANFDKALESIKIAKSISPNNLDINLDYANILSSLNKKKEAIQILNSIENSYKKDARVYYNLGCLYIDILNYKDAIECFKKTLELDPKNKQASFNLGICFFNDEQYENSLKVFQTTGATSLLRN